MFLNLLLLYHMTLLFKEPYLLKICQFLETWSSKAQCFAKIWRMRSCLKMYYHRTTFHFNRRKYFCVFMMHMTSIFEKKKFNRNYTIEFLSFTLYEIKNSWKFKKQLKQNFFKSMEIDSFLYTEKNSLKISYNFTLFFSSGV